MDCGTCGRSHRTEEALKKCQVRAEKKAGALKKKADDAERRRSNAEKKSAADFISEQRFSKVTHWPVIDEPPSFSSIVAKLNRDYPPPDGKEKWTLVDVVDLDSKRLKWPI